MTMDEKFMLCEEKKEDFEGFAGIMRQQTEVGKKLKSASYQYEIRNRLDDPTKYFANEWLEIEAGGYRYKINAAYNSALANEQQLLAVLFCPEEIQGLMEVTTC
jgi:hypothetical protein